MITIQLTDNREITKCWPVPTDLAGPRVTQCKTGSPERNIYIYATLMILEWQINVTIFEKPKITMI